jgi:hypothetical protein
MLNPLGSLGAVALPEAWFDSGCGSSTAKARWLPDGRIELQGNEHAAPMPKAVRQWDSLIRAAASKHDVPPQLVAGILATESGGTAGLSSYAGAGGLMGLMPSTADWLAGRTVSKNELLADHDLNVDLGAKLIAYNLKRYNGNIVKVALAYNAGNVKCGAPKNCPGAPNQWNAVTDCDGPKGVGGKAVDYPARMFKYSNDWLAQAGSWKLDLDLDVRGAVMRRMLPWALAASAVGLAYANRDTLMSKLKANPAKSSLIERAVLAAQQYQASIDLPIKTQQRFCSRLMKLVEQLATKHGMGESDVFEQVTREAERRGRVMLRPAKDY